MTRNARTLQHVGTIKMASQENVKLFIHLITDGRQPAESAEELILYVKSKIVDFGVGRW